jgi:hypothetical protein
MQKRRTKKISAPGTAGHSHGHYGSGSHGSNAALWGVTGLTSGLALGSLFQNASSKPTVVYAAQPSPYPYPYAYAPNPYCGFPGYPPCPPPPPTPPTSAGYTKKEMQFRKYKLKNKGFLKAHGYSQNASQASRRTAIKKALAHWDEQKEAPMSKKEKMLSLQRHMQFILNKSYTRKTNQKGLQNFYEDIQWLKQQRGKI